MPIPPPPPPGPPPPPAPSFQQNIGGAPDPNGRNLLLQSIRQGTRLKKAVTNDRSAPTVGGNKSNNSRSPPGGGGNSIGSSGNGGSGFGGGGGGRSAGPGPLGLGDLFAGGIPKLKPVGSSGARSKGFSSSSTSLHRPEPAFNNHNQSQSRETGSINSYSSSTSSLHHIDRAGSGNNSPSSIHMSLSHKAPPPPPPPSNLKPGLGSGDHGGERKPINYGKPSVAPKPPGINNGGGGGKSSKPNPPPKLPSLYIPPPPPLPNDMDCVDSGHMPSTPPSAGGTSVNRAQSMRMPKTASPVTPSAASIEYRTMGRSAGREFAAMNASGQPPPPPRIIANGGARVRMSPLRPPTARPPPPPSNKAPPAVPPPPPPASAPPPPRHRISPAPTPPQVRVNGSLGPLPPVPAGGAPPPPPTRNSSMRSVNSATSVTTSSSGSSTPSYTGVDLESRFGHLFPSLEDLPRPGLFMGIVKTYPSKHAHSIKRQPAPQPPTQMQLGSKMWANNTSTC